MRWNRTGLLVIGVFLAFNLLFLNQTFSLWDDDEAAYAGFAQQMLRSGDWVNLDYQWSSVHRKPPLHIWTVAISFRILGENEFALRLPSAVAVWLTCASVWWFGRRPFGEDRAAWAAVILASSFVLPVFGKVALTDATLLLFQTTAALGLLNHIHQPRARWNALLWTSVALGALAKGPPVLILIGGLWAWLLAFHPQRRNLLGTQPWLFLPCALLPLGAWLYLSWQRDGGGLVAFLYDWYVRRRIGGNVLGHSGPPGYHLVVLLLSFAGWMPFLAMAVGERVRAWRRAWSPNQIALAGWMVFGWLFFEVMSSKTPSYALAAQPAWALAIAPQVCRAVPPFPRAFRAAVVLQTAVWLGLLGSVSAFAYRLIGAQSLWPVGLLLAVAAVTGTWAVTSLWRWRPLGSLYSVAFAMTFVAMLTNVAAAAVEPSRIKSTRRMVATAFQWAHESGAVPVYYTGLDVQQKRPALAVYLSRRFRSHSEVIPAVAVERYFSPEPALFIVGTRAEEVFRALGSRQPGMPTARLQRVDWLSTNDRLRSHPFWLLRNFD